MTRFALRTLIVVIVLLAIPAAYLGVENLRGQERVAAKQAGLVLIRQGDGWAWQPPAAPPQEAVGYLPVPPTPRMIQEITISNRDCHPTLSPDQTILALDGHCDAETVARMMEGSFVRREAFEALRAEVEVLKKGRLR